MAPKQIFVNLPVADIKAATSFYEAIGAKRNAAFCDDVTSCMVFSESIYVMIMTIDRFTSFCPANKTTNVGATSAFFCLSADSHAECDDIAGRAEKAGGKIDVTTMPVNEVMYGRSFEDLDGHVWKLMWMDMEAMAKCRQGGAEKDGDAPGGVV